MTFEVATIAKITGISEKFTAHTGEPLSIIEEAHTIPGGCVLEPTGDVTAEYIIEFDPVVNICGSHGCLYHVVKKGPVQSADMVNKLKFPTRERIVCLLAHLALKMFRYDVFESF